MRNAPPRYSVRWLLGAIAIAAGLLAAYRAGQRSPSPPHLRAITIRHRGPGGAGDRTVLTYDLRDPGADTEARRIEAQLRTEGADYEVR